MLSRQYCYNARLDPFPSCFLAVSTKERQKTRPDPCLVTPACSQTTDREQRQRLQQHATELLAPLNALGSPLTGLPPDELALIEQVATESAQLFQRSSSCVEGRNGQLALHHHHLHRIRPRKLAALTTIHNY